MGGEWGGEGRKKIVTGYGLKQMTTLVVNHWIAVEMYFFVWVILTSISLQLVKKKKEKVGGLTPTSHLLPPPRPPGLPPSETLIHLHMNRHVSLFSENANISEANGAPCYVHRNERLSFPTSKHSISSPLPPHHFQLQIGNLQFARGIVSMLCLRGRIVSRPQADVILDSSTLGIQKPPAITLVDLGPKPLVTWERY